MEHGDVFKGVVTSGFISRSFLSAVTIFLSLALISVLDFPIIIAYIFEIAFVGVIACVDFAPVVLV